MIYKNELNDHPIVDHMSDILDEYEYSIYKKEPPWPGWPSELFS